jgi:hypothetical protein
MKNNNYDIASGMEAILKDPEYKSMFSSSAVLEKLAFKRVADEELPTEIEVELSAELMGEEPLEATAASKCKVCGCKTKGVCKCASGSCKGKESCGKGCSCECKNKKAGVEMDDMLIKSAFDSLMSASSDLEEAGFEQLSVNALVLMNHLIVEAKKAKDKKKDKGAKSKAEMAKEKADAAKAKAKAAADKAKAAAEKDKNDARDKKMKDQAAKEKAKAKMEAEKAKEKAKADKSKKK